MPESQSPDSSAGDTIDDLLGDVTGTLDSARQSRDSGAYDRALARCERAVATAKEARATAREDALDDAAAALDHLDGVEETLDKARAPIGDHEFPALADRLAPLEERHGRLRQQAKDARTRVPTTIPTTPRHPLSYDDIEKADRYETVVNFRHDLQILSEEVTDGF